MSGTRSSVPDTARQPANGVEFFTAKQKETSSPWLFPLAQASTVNVLGRHIEPF